MSICGGEVTDAGWRNADNYSVLDECDKARWAELWVKRNAAFLADLKCLPCNLQQDDFIAQGKIRLIKCHVTCPLKRWGVRCARMDTNTSVFFWASKCNPQILSVEATSVESLENAVDLRHCSLLKAVFKGPSNNEQLLFSDGSRTLQLNVCGASVLSGPVNLCCTLHGWHEFETKPLSLRRLCNIYKQDRMIKALYPKEKRTSRWVQMLQAWDGFQAGAHYRDIARVIYGTSMADGLWHDGYRTRTQRLIRSAKQMISGGYLNLLM